MYIALSSFSGAESPVRVFKTLDNRSSAWVRPLRMYRDAVATQNKETTCLIHQLLNLALHQAIRSQTPVLLDQAKLMIEIKGNITTDEARPNFVKYSISTLNRWHLLKAPVNHCIWSTGKQET